jgi:hypothetical protein
MKPTALCAALVAGFLATNAHAITRASVILFCEDPTEILGTSAICVSMSMTSAAAIESVITDVIGMHSLHQSPSGYLSEYPHEFAPVPLGQSSSDTADFRHIH